MKRALLYRLLLLIFTFPAWAQETEQEQLPVEPDFSAQHFFYGYVTAQQTPIAGAMVTLYHGNPVHSLTVFTDDKGRYLTPALPWQDQYSIRVRRAGWKDQTLFDLVPEQGGSSLSFDLNPINTPTELAAQLPANYWYHLMFEHFDSQQELYEFKQQCTFCHQQGTPITRLPHTEEHWNDVILNMGRRGAILTHSLRDKLPGIYSAAYDPDLAVKKLAQYQGENGPLPIPSIAARRAVVEEWDLGGASSMQHDMMVYPKDDSIWSVDGPIDTLHKISFDNNADGERVSYAIPRGNHKVGGVYWRMEEPVSQPVDTYLAPHSLQTAPDGRIWLTLAKGNQLAGFDPVNEHWEVVDLKQGVNPHTLRFDKRGRLWYTVTATNHVAMFDPTTKEQHFIRLPSPDLGTDIVLRMTPFLISHAHWFNLSERSSRADGVSMPMPYGIDINPIDDSIWYSQLNFGHIGRIDPDTFEVTPIETPFVTPRRLRFDSQGMLWIPSYSESSLNHYNPYTKEWKSWPVPIEPLGSEVPYAVAVNPKTGYVWITGTQSDTMIRFNPDTEEFTVYPFPNRGTYTREIDFDSQGYMWTSHSSAPAWHVESGIPKVSRIMPNAAPDIESSGLFDHTTALQQASLRK